jgi:membrane protein DedA with SNARE-associated domain
MSDVLRSALLTLAALALGYALWVVSDTVVGWSGVEHWLPLLRLGTVILGLTAADVILALLLRRASFLRIPSKGDTP